MGDEFNLLKLRARARAVARRNSDGLWRFNPFRQIVWDEPTRPSPSLPRELSRSDDSIERGFDGEGNTERKPFTVANQIQRVFFGAWINVLLLCAPAGITLHAVLGDHVATFVVNMIALVPLNFMVDLSLREISLRLGNVLGGLLSTSTSNFVQLVSSIILLKSHQAKLIQTSLAGGILVNILFILGLSILCGGSARRCQYFTLEVAHTSANVLSLAATSILIPTASLLLSQTTEDYVVKQSRGASFVLMAVYASFLVYQFKTHSSLFKQESEKVPSSFRLSPSKDAIATGISRVGAEPALLRGSVIPALAFPVAIATFVGFSALLAVCVDFAVGSINSLSTQGNLSSTFIGLILLPIPNCEFTTTTYALDDTMNIVMTFTIVKCLQTALFVMPLSVLLGWGLGVNEVTLVFSGFEVVSLFAAVVLLNFLLTEGKVTWYDPIPY
ncbi:hypothetical protein F5Y02DRAFT_429834 [Annulohypoxylon stygium]|nr:hypothetical protein F5Y02DRAFT_429834 [Annulohypoxylon stygium]